MCCSLNVSEWREKERRTYRFVDQLFASIAFSGEVDDIRGKATETLSGVQTLPNEENRLERTSRIFIHFFARLSRVPPRLSHRQTLLIRTEGKKSASLPFSPLH